MGKDGPTRDDIAVRYRTLENFMKARRGSDDSTPVKASVSYKRTTGLEAKFSALSRHGVSEWPAYAECSALLKRTTTLRILFLVIPLCALPEVYNDPDRIGFELEKKLINLGDEEEMMVLEEESRRR